MMMTKPTDEAQKEAAAPPAFAAPPPSSIHPGSVEDLQRKLAMISAGENKAPAPAPPAVQAPAAVPPITAVAAAAPAAVPVKGGKNALLARIMAAKEKSQQAKAPPAPAAAAPTDLLSDFDAPASVNDPPPTYNTNFLAEAPPPAMSAPPAFDVFENTTSMMMGDSQFPAPPPPPIDDVLPPPPPPSSEVLPPPSAPAASAPSFEDLLDGGGGETTQRQHPFAMMPPPMEVPMAPPPAELDIDESILNALEPAEREAFLEEQRKIMEQIEKEKTGNQTSGAAARAAAFDQRSSAAVAQVAASYEGSASRSGGSATRKSRPTTTAAPAVSSGRTVNLGEGTEVPLHGQEKTQQAIKDGTALIVQCLSCSNWMQVTGEAEVMMCPICNVITRVETAGAATSADMEAAAQMAADAELAEKLQKEEYARAQGGGGGGSGTRSRSRQAASSSSRQAQSNSGEEQSWYDWIVGTPAPAPSTSAAIASGARSAEIRPQTGLISAQTGEESRVGRSRSYDESEGLVGRGGGARVAESKSMFACVADAVGTAATQMTAYNLSEDDEGNVHGVDGSSLLAMPDVSRQRE